MLLVKARLLFISKYFRKNYLPNIQRFSNHYNVIAWLLATADRLRLFHVCGLFKLLTETEQDHKLDIRLYNNMMYSKSHLM